MSLFSTGSNFIPLTGNGEGKILYGQVNAVNVLKVIDVHFVIKGTEYHSKWDDKDKKF